MAGGGYPLLQGRSPYCSALPLPPLRLRPSLARPPSCHPLTPDVGTVVRSSARPACAARPLTPLLRCARVHGLPGSPPVHCAPAAALARPGRGRPAPAWQLPLPLPPVCFPDHLRPRDSLPRSRPTSAPPSAVLHLYVWMSFFTTVALRAGASRGPAACAARPLACCLLGGRAPALPVPRLVLTS